MITGVDKNEWTADLNCQSDLGKPAKKLRANFGGYDGVSTDNGVSYSVKVDEEGRLGSYKVEVSKWVVLE